MLKAVGLGSVFILLLIGLAAIGGVSSERAQRERAAVAEIRDSWGPGQVLAGPFLRVPVETTRTVTEQVPGPGGGWVDKAVAHVEEEVLWVLPDRLDCVADLATEVRQRGIFEAVVYASEIGLEATFDPAAIDTDGFSAVHWGEAAIVLLVSDGTSLRSTPVARLGERELAPSPGHHLDGWKGSVSMPVGDVGLEELGPVSIELELQGTEQIAFATIAKEQGVRISGDWPHPSFRGPPLPVAREVFEDGFNARWQSTEFAREWPAAFSREARNPHLAHQFRGTTVGVELLQPVNGYRMVERSLKYGILFIATVFSVFLICELRLGLRVHPVQYLFVGAALVLFFLGFLALSEVIGVTAGYAVAAVLSTGLVGLYSRSVFQAGHRAWILGGGLGGVYVYLYFVLWSESFALLAGSAVLFGLLAAVMWFTRDVQWYRENRDTVPEPIS